MQSIQHRGVFDVPEVEGGESNDNTEDYDAFQQETIVDIVSINVEDNIIDYCMGDVETEVVLEGGTSRNTNQNEEHYLMLILIWIMICRVHNNCLKCYVFVLKFYAYLSSNCFVLIFNLIWILMWSFVGLSS